MPSTFTMMDHSVSFCNHLGFWWALFSQVYTLSGLSLMPLCPITVRREEPWEGPCFSLCLAKYCHFTSWNAGMVQSSFLAWLIATWARQVWELTQINFKPNKHLGLTEPFLSFPPLLTQAKVKWKQIILQLYIVAHIFKIHRGASYKEMQEPFLRT